MFTIALDNQTSTPLVPYPVVTNPPPPHRVADPANAVPWRDRKLIDTSGFNPAYYQDSTKLGLVIQLALFEDPPELLVATLQYKVPPGQAGSDPALQPTKLAEFYFSPTKQKLSIRVDELGSGLGVSFIEIGN